MSLCISVGRDTLIGVCRDASPHVCIDNSSYLITNADNKGTKRPREDDGGIAEQYAKMPWGEMLQEGEARLKKMTVNDLKVR